LSREVLDEYIEKLKDSPDIDLGAIIEDLVSIGFADENDLCKALDIDDTSLDHLANASHEYTDKQINIHAKALIKYLKRIRKSYEHHYFRSTA
jgi:hypothetical protein